MLIKEIDDFFNCLVVFYVFIDEESTETFTIDLTNFNFKLSISINRKSWKGWGKYPDSFLKALKDFNTFYFKILAEDFKNLVNAFKDFPLDIDVEIPEAIRNNIKKAAAILFFHLLKIRYQLQKCMINE